MSVMESEVFEAFRASEIPEEKALKAAAALSKRDDDVASLKGELLVLKWMMGSRLPAGDLRQAFLALRARHPGSG